MKTLEAHQEGDNLVTADGSTYYRFFSQVEDDPFKAGVHWGSSAPMRIMDVMDFSEIGLVMSLSGYSHFEQAISDINQRERFNHGWIKAFGLSAAFAFDEEQDDERFGEVVDTLTFFGKPFDELTVATARDVSRFIKRAEFTELQRGMSMFANAERDGITESDYTGFTNFHSYLSELSWRLRGIDPYDKPGDDAKLDAAAVVIAEMYARRKSAAYMLGKTAMAFEHTKTTIWEV